MNSDTYPRLQGPWLTAARIGWLVFFSIATLTLLVAFPARWTELMHPGPNTLSNLHALGWSVQAYAILFLALEMLFAAAYLFVGLVIFLRRSDDRMALFISYTLIAFGFGNQTISLTVTALRPYPLGEFIFAFGGFAAWSAFAQFPFLFPNGHYVPKWSRIPAILWFAVCIPWNFMVNSPLYPPSWPPIIFGPLFTFLWGSFAVSQIYRYRRVSTPLERQQTKWVIYALAMIVIILILMVSLSFYYHSNLLSILSFEEITDPQTFVFGWISQVGSMLAFLLLPVAFAFSILRYRLWDIDILIRRTLQYSLLTGLLALMYFGSIILLQNLFSAVSNQQSEISIVLSTLTIAALFNPLRRRVQDFIDRRFYRKKYDAERALAQFATTARDEVDMDRLTAALIGVVQETVQPEKVSIWLAANEDRRQT